MLSAPLPKHHGEPWVEPAGGRRSAEHLRFPSSFLRLLFILIYFNLFGGFVGVFFWQIAILEEAWSAAKAFFSFRSL